MKINILTLFPEMFTPLQTSIIGRAVKNGIIDINLINIRDFSQDKHKKCDDYPFGGGLGMVMMPEPIYKAIEHTDPNHECLRIFMSCRGKKLSVKTARELALSNKDLLILCGHYEGVDQRVIDLCIDMEICIGDYVLTGGELPSMVLVDTVSRFIPGVLGDDNSALDESFTDGLLEYPQYTRPQNFKGLEVPQVLLSGHHENISKWRRQAQSEVTQKNRPDLLSKS